MTLIWGIAAVAIYFGIIGILIKDAMDQIRRQKAGCGREEGIKPSVEEISGISRAAGFIAAKAEEMGEDLMTIIEWLVEEHLDEL